MFHGLEAAVELAGRVHGALLVGQLGEGTHLHAGEPGEVPGVRKYSEIQMTL